jgi:K+ transporter
MQLKPAAAPSAPTQASFLSLVYPSLIITYLGQTAMILKK